MGADPWKWPPLRTGVGRARAVCAKLFMRTGIHRRTLPGVLQPSFLRVLFGGSAAARGLVAVALAAALWPSDARPAPPGEESLQSPDPTVAEVTLVGLDQVDPPLEPPRRLPRHPDGPWSPERESATEDLLADLLAERGRPYALVEATSRETEPGRFEVTVEVLDPGPEVRFGPVHIEAIPPLTEAMIRQRLAYAEGELFRPSLLQQTRDRLLREAAVGRAIALPVGLLEGDTAATTVVSAAPEERLRSPELHGILSSGRCLEVSGYWRDRYFLGAPRVLSLGGGFSNLLAREMDGRFPCSDAGGGEHAGRDYWVEGDLQVPWPGDPLTVVRGGAFFERRSTHPVYVARALGGRVEVSRELSATLRGSAGYRFQRMDLRAVGTFLCANFGACTEDAMAGPAGPQRWAPLEGSLNWLPTATRAVRGEEPGRRPQPEPGAGENAQGSLDPAERLLVPEWRPWAEGRVAAAGRATGSETAYGRFQVRAGLARTMGQRGEVAGRLRLGGLVKDSGAQLPQTFFFGGGAGSVRGVAGNLLGPAVLYAESDALEELGCAPEPGGCADEEAEGSGGPVAGPDDAELRPRGGTLVLEASLEGRIRLARRVQGAAFVDAGLLRSPAMAVGEPPAPASMEAVITPGLGVRLDTPLGLIRVDVAADPRGSRQRPVLARWDENLAVEDGAQAGDLVPMGEATYDPFTYDDPSTLRELARRLHFTVGVGQPF